ncbi:LysR family transcriptional regulator [Noviherbaspirillum malthae]|uniref:LysR family transcriptional regulator n=1 Tax=Noviherbaspirillum malthae TaxID=1260987 RepID=UPI00188E7342|nr:LysR family transcriptional regulator [Noviherbaspirillum malthae]
MLSDDVDYFLSLAASGTFTRTAERLGISQPALSKAIQRLEKKMGVKLLIRTVRGVELTDAGRALHLRLQSVSRDIDNAMQEARDLGGNQAGLLRVGITPATTDFAIRALLPQLITERPAAHISFTTAFSAVLVDAVSRREVDFAVCPIPEHVAAPLEHELLYEDPVALMLNRTHPLAKRRKLPLEELVKYPWAGTRRHELTRSQMERVLSAQGLPRPRMVVEADTLNGLIMIVSQTQLLSMINTRGVRPEALPDNVIMRPAMIEGLDRQIGIVRRAGYASPIAERAQELIRVAAQ